MDRHKLGIIVPYRDREQDLPIFIDNMTNYLNTKNIRYEIIIVNQDGGKQFNRGMLLNIGYTYAKKLKCDYIVFHDVDMIPLEVDYSFSEIPLHLATDFLLDVDEKKREVFEEYFGGVTMFTIEDFEKIISWMKNWKEPTLNSLIFFLMGILFSYSSIILFISAVTFFPLSSLLPSTVI